MNSYWVVSPNIGQTKSGLARWKQIILKKHVAVMGWGPNKRIGRRFVEKVEPGDVILIARRHKGKPEILGFGRVRGPAVLGKTGGKDKESIKGMDTPTYFGSYRNLSPFKHAEPPSRIPLIKALGHTMALAKLNPHRHRAHERVCEWMDQLLPKTESRKAVKERRVPHAREEIRVVPLSKAGSFGYMVHSEKMVQRAIKKESKLLDDYRRWIQRKCSQELSAIQIGKLTCDCFEKKRGNLIEAKKSTRREDIRMAVGQLLEYGFHAKKEFRTINMGILLPKKPSPSAVEWLRPLNIGLIWQDRKAFRDNGNGRFT